jgi:hypothetical protein
MKERENVGEQSVNFRITLKWISRKYGKKGVD